MIIKNGTYRFDRLKNFPVSFLAICLGMVGFTLAWQKAEHILRFPFQMSGYLLYASIGTMAVIIGIYLLKVIKFPDEVKKELNHPIKLNFFPILAKLFLITSIIYLSIDVVVSRYLWWVGVVIQFIFTIAIMSAWIRHEKFEVQHINPSWFIPVVGCIIIPIAGVQHFSAELSWFFFSIGLFWWLILTTLVMNRIIFHHPIPDKLIPTFFILFAPPVIGFISLTKLMGGLNIFGNLLFYFSAFLFMLIMFQYRMFSRIKFYLSWWAYSFPLSALTIGTLLMYHETGSSIMWAASWAMFVLLNAAILVLWSKTSKAIRRKEICVEEKE
ncbi:MAG: C4-dicarboxylate ABC transporter [Candidatus Aenigmatarchaeota archaeon]|nr:MAG: C4-dicarboxylate ABC transporter [Candidatus Aenigmarchaeota archaeon]